MAASYVKFESFALALGQGLHQLHAAGHQFKAYLTNATPSVSADDVKADLAEISNENGYTAPVDIQNDYTEASGTGTFTAVDIQVEASGGTIGPFRYVVIYNDTHATDALVCYHDYGSSITLQDGETFDIDFGASLFTLA